MKENLQLAKKEMKDKSRAYQTYGYYLVIPIISIILFILSFLNFDTGTMSTVLFVFTIVANVGVSKLELLSKKKYVAPIMIYIINILSILLLPILIMDISSSGTGDMYFIIMGLIVFPLEIIAIIFFFITAKDIKKNYPEMKEESKQARQKYMEIKRNK